MDCSYYIAVFYLPECQSIKIGKLGTFNFSKGYYFYVGKDRRNIRARVSRHISLRKKCRWHIDYLSLTAEPVFVCFLDDRREGECKIQTQLKAIGGEITVPGFGASDCTCESHLLYFTCIPEAFYQMFLTGREKCET